MKPIIFKQISVLALSLTFGLACDNTRSATKPGDSTPQAAEKVPITTVSEEAREAYLLGRDSLEKLREADAREHYEQAVALDPDFAMAHLAMAQTSPTAREFFDSLERAIELAPGVSEGERRLILFTEAGTKSEPESQLAYLNELVEIYPNDERMHNFLGNFYFGRQEYDKAIHHYELATNIDPDFSQPYNQMGYAYRYRGDYEGAEKAFKKYVTLIPEEPNPYDSYAELLMEMGRFEESIENYRKALEIDPGFVYSFRGIAIDQMLMGEMEAARSTLLDQYQRSRDVGQARTALVWTAASYIHEGKFEAAIAEVHKMSDLAEAEGDVLAMARDHNLIGDILLEAGRTEEASKQYAKWIYGVNKSTVSKDIKSSEHRNLLAEEARVALAEGKLEKATLKLDAFEKESAARKLPFAIWRAHELRGMIAIERGDFRSAIAELEKANLRDPRVLYHLARAHAGAGDHETALETAKKSANFNGLDFNYAFVRGKAQQLVKDLGQ